MPPATALIFTEDHPKRRPAATGARRARHGRVEHPDNLDRWTNPAYRLATVILIRAGLRVTDALRLEHDCVVTDPAGAPTCATSTTR